MMTKTEALEASKEQPKTASQETDGSNDATISMADLMEAELEDATFEWEWHVLDLSEGGGWYNYWVHSLTLGISLGTLGELTHWFKHELSHHTGGQVRVELDA
jgi:hypothetical protein